jgi:hypothetical protein
MEKAPRIHDDKWENGRGKAHISSSIPVFSHATLVLDTTSKPCTN